MSKETFPVEITELHQGFYEARVTVRGRQYQSSGNDVRGLLENLAHFVELSERENTQTLVGHSITVELPDA